MIYLLLIFLLGMMTPVQTAANSRLRQSVVSPLVASLVSFTIGTTYLIIATLIQRGSLGISAEAFNDLPWWTWLGGIIGGTFVTGFAFFAAKVGIGLLLVTSICGLLTCSLIIDKQGLLGTAKKTVGWVQYVGLLCVMAGIAILRLN